MNSAGIAVFAYNRLDHLKRVLDALKENNVEHIYIFSDGAKDTQDKQRVNEVREYIDQIDWCRTTVTAHRNNLGLAKSLTHGIERVLEDHSRIVVLEDDCVPASNFISFMEYSLERYADNEQVMNVNGYSPQIDIPVNYPYDVYFTYRSSSWGWGTWKSAWEHYEQEPFSLDKLKNNSAYIKQKVKKAGHDLYPMMRKQLQGDIDSWAVWWSYVIASRDGICVNPVDSKVRNIGFDGSGTHTGGTNKYETTLDETPVSELLFPDEPIVSEQINSTYNHVIGGGERNQLKQKLAHLLKSFGLWGIYQQIRHGK